MLDDLVDDAEAAVEAAAGGSAEALGAATRARSAAVAFRAGQLPLLAAAEGRMAWSSRLPAAVEIARTPEVRAEHRLRQAAGGADAETLLKSSQIPPRMHETGKVVMAPGRAGSGDRLRMRGMPLSQGIKTNSNRQHQLAYAYGGSSIGAYLVSRSLQDIRNNQPLLVAGLTIRPDGLAVDIGGDGAEGTDFRAASFGHSINPANRNLAPYVPGSGGSFGGRANGYDLSLSFGRPSASPQGAAEHRWLAELMPTEAQVAAAGGEAGWLKSGGETRPLGVYDVRLSNHIGRNAKTEFEDGTPFPDDDENFYLIHAAYGFMDFYRPGIGLGASHPERGIHRVFPFHVGYDAFADRRGSRTTDIAEAIIGATFKGRTIAEEFTYANITPAFSAPFLSPTDTKRMRGDIELTATISATASSNTIAGTISSMQDWVVSQDGFGSWRDSTTIAADIRFDADGTIDAKGEFTGTFANYPAGFANGGYRGNFYGPVGSLEAAGTWVMSPASGSTSSQNGRAIAGSFGAAIVRDDGSYGTKVTGGGSGN